MKKLVTAALCALLVSSAPVFTVNTFASDAKPKFIAQLPNPFIECTTIEDAQKNAGFEITLPKSIPEGFKEEVIQAIKGDLIDVIYKSTDNELRIRKCLGLEDCSGNYFDYKQMVKVKINDEDAILKCKNGKAYVAVWNDGTYSYSISVDDQSSGLDQSVMTALMRELQ
ncbi:MAG: DUF4367 domain-containing protein [Candidatus Metalachnospira sp.]|nr:DUF4367 domain-containing protein [Candidatus Metalachnospira sp.]